MFWLYLGRAEFVIIREETGEIALEGLSNFLYAVRPDNPLRTHIVMTAVKERLLEGEEITLTKSLRVFVVDESVAPIEDFHAQYLRIVGFVSGIKQVKLWDGTVELVFEPSKITWRWENIKGEHSEWTKYKDEVGSLLFDISVGPQKSLSLYQLIQAARSYEEESLKLTMIDEKAKMIELEEGLGTDVFPFICSCTFRKLEERKFRRCPRCLAKFDEECVELVYEDGYCIVCGAPVKREK